jgi:hypothetical protein
MGLDRLDADITYLRDLLVAVALGRPGAQGKP